MKTLGSELNRLCRILEEINRGNHNSHDFEPTVGEIKDLGITAPILFGDLAETWKRKRFDHLGKEYWVQRDITRIEQDSQGHIDKDVKLTKTGGTIALGQSIRNFRFTGPHIIHYNREGQLLAEATIPTLLKKQRGEVEGKITDYTYQSKY